MDLGKQFYLLLRRESIGANDRGTRNDPHPAHRSLGCCGLVTVACICADQLCRLSLVLSSGTSPRCFPGVAVLLAAGQVRHSNHTRRLILNIDTDYDHADKLHQREMRGMKKYLFLTLLLLSISPALTGIAANLEARIGTGPSIAIDATWDISPNLGIAASFGADFGGGAVQTGSATVQTPSYTIGMRVTYRFLPETSRIRPYFGFGGHLALQGTTFSPLLETLMGVHTQLTRNIYLLGEASAYFPIPDVASWYWRAYLGIGFRLRF